MRNNILKRFSVSAKASLAVCVAAGAMLGSTALAIDFPGYIKVEQFNDINGGTVALLLAAPKYTNNQPDIITFPTSLFYAPAVGRDNYGTRVTGYIVPTETTNFVFYVSGDDEIQFRLSTDATPANLQYIATEPQWNNGRDWTGTTEAGAVGRRPVASNPEVGQTLPNISLPKALTAGQRYYFQILHKEGTTGDTIGVAWAHQGGPAPADGVAGSEIPAANLIAEHPTTGLLITQQPTNVAVFSGQPATFYVTAVGPPGDSDTSLYSYQWRTNGVDIADGTGNAVTYNIPSTTVADHGKILSVQVTSTLGSNIVSTNATLSVTLDNQAPRIVSVRSDSSFTTATVTYSEPMADAAAIFGNYVFGGGLAVSDAQFATFNAADPADTTNRIVVVLTTSQQTEGAVYNLTVNGVTDPAGNALSPNNGVLNAAVFKSGMLNYRRWYGRGTQIANLTNNPVSMGSPTSTGIRTLAESGNFGVGQIDYLALLEGYVIPSVTTNYVFYFNADNDGFLYLSTDANPGNRRMIAADVGWQNERQWTGPGGDATKRRGDTSNTNGLGPFENRSDELLTSMRALTGSLAGLPTPDGADPEPWPTVDGAGNAVISLVAGQRYYMQLWHVEFESGHIGATYKQAGANDPALGSVSILTGNLIGTYVDPSSLPPVITNQPVAVDFTVGSTLNFSVGVDSAIPVTYQWNKNGTAIAGATNSTLTITNAGAADVAGYNVAVANVNGAVNSAIVLAFAASPAPGKTFQQDATGLLVIEAENYFDSTRGSAGHAWVPQSTRTLYSGSGYMQVLADAAVANGGAAQALPNSPRLNFKAMFSTNGTHYLWIRGGDPTAGGAGDSVFAGLDGAIGADMRGNPTFNTAAWNWVGQVNGNTVATLDVPATGEHTFTLWMREDGFLADKIILTTDAAFVPIDGGPAESAQASTGPTLSITTVAGAPQITFGAGATLQYSANVSGTYADIVATSPFTPTQPGFYRARQ